MRNFLKLAAAAAFIATAHTQPLQETGDQCVQNCFMTSIVGVGATAACGNGNDYVSQAICYCQTPGLGDAYSGCLGRCPEGDIEQGQQLRDQVCAAANGGGEEQKDKGNHHDNHDKEGKEGHDEHHKEQHKQDPGTQVAGIISESIPQAQGNMGEYAAGAGTATQGQGETQPQPQQAAGAEQAGWTSSQDMQMPTQTSQSMASQTPTSSASSQTFKSLTKTHSTTSSTTASPTTTANDLDSSAGSTYQVSWGVAVASTLVLYFLV